ncbi:MAG: hypothetical protein R3332_13615 [Pseudohongiellaceae bacterium]|nr:hypothetical protein [Pseudohongiellaceae bacterium]
MQNLIKTAGAIILIAGTQVTLASDHHVVREHIIDASDITEFRIDAGVGVLDVDPSEDNELRIELEIEGNRQGFFRRGKRDVTDLDVEIKKRGDILYVELNDDDFDDLELHWRITLPSLERTHLDLSVGQINAKLGATALDVELGVGEANISAPHTYVGNIEVDVGVGSAKLRGADNIKSDRAIVSEEVVGNGFGHMDMTVDVGVGEANVKLSPAS